jgi:hypothetical protein
MMTQWSVFVKTLVKSSLDNYILPGTLTGTEILWLYVTQWKRDLATITFASLYFICSQFDFIRLEKQAPESEMISEDIEQFR